MKKDGELEMKDIYVMMKPVSGLCNMRCQYCFYMDEMENREKGNCGFMSEETLEHIIEKALLVTDEVCTFAYQGGEPTLAGIEFFEKSIKFQEKYNKKKIKIQNVLQTNGYALDEKWCRFFAENGFLIGVSVDGIKETHDKYRKTIAGEETYFKILENIRMLEKYGVEYNVLTVINGKTAPKIGRIYEKYKKLGFRYQQYIVCLDPAGKMSGGEEYSLTPDAYGQFLLDLFRLWEIDWKQGCQPVIRQFENWVGILKGYLPEACEQRGVCGVQNIVEADGSVYPCDFYAMDGYQIGNILRDSFEEIYQKRTQSGFIEESRNYPVACKACKYYHLCRGGCRRHRDEEGENYFCQSYKMFFGQYYDKLQAIANIRIY